MSNIKEVKFGKQPPSDLSRILRELADQVDAGEVTSLVAAYVDNDEYAFVLGGSLQEELVMASLLKRKILSKFWVEG